MSDIISREGAILAILNTESKVARETPYDSKVFGVMAKRQNEILDVLLTLPSAEPPYQYSKAYVEQIRGERDILQDMVNNMAEPKTEMVLCALADRTCPFQGKEYAWCLTCPHISEEDRELVKKAVAEPKTGEWVKVIDEETPNVTKWHYECDQCGAGQYENGQRYCSNCGAKMEGGEEE